MRNLIMSLVLILPFFVFGQNNKVNDTIIDMGRNLTPIPNTKGKVIFKTNFLYAEKRVDGVITDYEEIFKTTFFEFDSSFTTLIITEDGDRPKKYDLTIDTLKVNDYSTISNNTLYLDISKEYFICFNKNSTMYLSFINNGLQGIRIDENDYDLFYNCVTIEEYNKYSGIAEHNKKVSETKKTKK